MIDLLINNTDDDGSQGMFQEIDMGEIDEEERQYLLIDKDTGKVYDLRNEVHLQKITSKQTRLTTDMNNVSTSSHQSSQIGGGGGSSKQQSAWGDWWREKKRNNQDLLWSSENGNLDEVKRLLDKEKLQDMVADVNHKGLDNWTALHFAANEGNIEVVKELLTHLDIEREPMSSINRTPLHLAAIRGHTNIVRSIIESPLKPPVDRNVKDCDENTPLHYSSEYGHSECIIYLVKEAMADPYIKNKYGYTPSDIAQNMRIRQLFDSLIPRASSQSLSTEAQAKLGYGRTAVNGVLRHNDRINTV